MRRVTQCALCGERSREKMAAFYWAWTWPTGARRSYKQLMDFECSTAHLRRVVLAEQREYCCIACGVEIPEDAPAQYLWLTMYLPGAERQDACLTWHPACFEQNEEHFTFGAQRLADRGVEAGGPPPPLPGHKWGSWRQMGLEST